jgi:hypothetical protein
MDVPPRFAAGRHIVGVAVELGHAGEIQYVDHAVAVRVERHEHLVQLADLQLGRLGAPARFQGNGHRRLPISPK